MHAVLRLIRSRSGICRNEGLESRCRAQAHIKLLQTVPLHSDIGFEMTDEYPEKTCTIDRLVTHDKLVAAALNGSKTQQRRAGVYGYPGERFTLEETEFEITGLRTERWGDITEEDAQREGYPNLQMYHALIERMHQGMEWDQDQPVWVHEFAKAD